MIIKSHKITVRDIFNGYIDKDDDGVFAYGGRLAIRPPYQREFVYDHKQEEAVIHTVLRNFPLNVMYWVKTGEKSYEILDGQQRTLSIMRFLDRKFSIIWNEDTHNCDSLPTDIYKKILDYELMVYNVDVTWNDSSGQDHMYLLLSDAEIQRRHEWHGDNGTVSMQIYACSTDRYDNTDQIWFAYRSSEIGVNQS